MDKKLQLTAIILLFPLLVLADSLTLVKVRGKEMVQMTLPQFTYYWKLEKNIDSIKKVIAYSSIDIKELSKLLNKEKELNKSKDSLYNNIISNQNQANKQLSIENNDLTTENTKLKDRLKRINKYIRRVSVTVVGAVVIIILL